MFRSIFTHVVYLESRQRITGRHDCSFAMEHGGTHVSICPTPQRNWTLPATPSTGVIIDTADLEDLCPKSCSELAATVLESWQRPHQGIQCVSELFLLYESTMLLCQEARQEMPANRCLADWRVTVLMTTAPSVAEGASPSPRRTTYNAETQHGYLVPCWL